MALLCLHQGNDGAKAYWLGEEREEISSEGLTVPITFEEMKLQTLQHPLGLWD